MTRIQLSEGSQPELGDPQLVPRGADPQAGGSISKQPCLHFPLAAPGAAAAAEASVGFATDSTHTTSKIRSFKECAVLKILPGGV